MAEEDEAAKEAESADGSGKSGLELTDLGNDATPESTAPTLEAPAAADYSDDDEGPQGLEAIYDIPVKVSAVLGKSSMQVSQLLKLGRGAVIELDRKVGEAIDIYVNNRLVARGEVVVVDDRLGVTMTEIIKTERT